ncbi:MAG: prolipoprotein diacylglyceryl transferase [Verrucomicrobiae bacterium]|nr:prolipoprotein diacylglyceryl transferase [Verrucomicrobiae bacterium]
MHPIFLSLGPLKIHWYGVFVALGFLAAFKVFHKRAPRIGLDLNEAGNLVVLLFLAGIVGARVYYVILNWQDFSAHPLEIFRIDHGGLVFYGGFLMSLLTLWLWCRWNKRAFALVMDAMVPALAIAQAFGRVGCFMNGCCYGRECDHFWAVRPGSPPEVAGHALHPVQLYETFGLLDIFLTLLVLEKLRRYPGYVACSYVLLYAFLRFFIEFFRGDLPRVILGRFTLAQGLCAILFAGAWIISTRLARRHLRSRNNVSSPSTS